MTHDGQSDNPAHTPSAQSALGEPAAPRSPVPETRALLRNHTEIWPMFKIILVNFFLTILTLGIYRFWAKTRLRRYLWGHVEILGDRLEYTGTGKELFLGFLSIFWVILLPMFFILGVLDAVLVEASSEVRAVKDITQMVLFLFLIGVAVFRARRYRLTRTHWRGIHGGQTGSSIKYGLLVLGCYLLAMVTLGLAWPACSVWIKRYEMRHTWIGDAQPEFTPRIGALYKPFLIAWVMVIAYISAVAAIFGGVLAISDTVSVTGEVEDAESLGFALLGVYLSIIPVSFFFLWYRGRAYHHFISSTRFLDHDMTSAISGLGFLWFAFGNWFLNLITLGFGAPFVYKRSMNFVERNVGLSGDGDFSTLLQNKQEKPSMGEGLADAFDVGAI